MYPFATPSGNGPFIIGLSEYTFSRKKNEKLKVFDNDASKWKIWKERMIDHFRQSTTKRATAIESLETAQKPIRQRDFDGASHWERRERVAGRRGA